MGNSPQYAQQLPLQYVMSKQDRGEEKSQYAELLQVELLIIKFLFI